MADPPVRIIVAIKDLSRICWVEIDAVAVVNSATNTGEKSAREADSKQNCYEVFMIELFA
jgi:hypothetical protein